MLNTKFAQQFVFATLVIASAVGLGAAFLGQTAIPFGFFAFFIVFLLYSGDKLNLID